MAKYDELKLRQMLFEDPMNFPESLPDDLNKRVINGTSFYTLPGGTGTAMTPSGDWSAANEQARINMIAREEKARKSRDFAATWEPKTKAGILAREDEIKTAQQDIKKIQSRKDPMWDTRPLISHIEGTIKEKTDWIRNARKELGVMGALDKDIEDLKAKAAAREKEEWERQYKEKAIPKSKWGDTEEGGRAKIQADIYAELIKNQGKLSPGAKMQFDVWKTVYDGEIDKTSKTAVEALDNMKKIGRLPPGVTPLPPSNLPKTGAPGAQAQPGAVIGRTKDGRVFMQTGQGKGTLDGIPVTFNPTDGNITYDITGKDVISLLPKRPDIGEIAKRVREEIGSDTAKVTQENIRNLYARAAKSGDWELRNIFKNLTGNFPSKAAVSMPEVSGKEKITTSIIKEVASPDNPERIKEIKRIAEEGTPQQKEYLKKALLAKQTTGEPVYIENLPAELGKWLINLDQRATKEVWDWLTNLGGMVGGLGGELYRK